MVLARPATLPVSQPTALAGVTARAAATGVQVYCSNGKDPYDDLRDAPGALRADWAQPLPGGTARVQRRVIQIPMPNPQPLGPSRSDSQSVGVNSRPLSSKKSIGVPLKLHKLGSSTVLRESLRKRQLLLLLLRPSLKQLLRFRQPLLDRGHRRKLRGNHTNSHLILGLGNFWWGWRDFWNASSGSVLPVYQLLPSDLETCWSSSAGVSNVTITIHPYQRSKTAIARGQLTIRTMPHGPLEPGE